MYIININNHTIFFVQFGRWDLSGILSQTGAVDFTQIQQLYNTSNSTVEILYI